MKKFIALIALSMFVFVACGNGAGNLAWDIHGDLHDVSGGSASGQVNAAFLDNFYSLSATFDDLPDPGEGFYYEGWIVGDEMISTGAISNFGGGVYVNTFSSEKDLTKLSKYVLTIEPDDGDPASADHVLEGDMTEV